MSRLFQIMILKFQYVSLSQNPSILVAETLTKILQKANRVPGIVAEKKHLEKVLNSHFQLFMYHIFAISKIKFSSKRIKLQKYTLANCLPREQRIHLELLLEMIIYVPDMAKRVDSYLFQIALYWTLQSL